MPTNARLGGNSQDRRRARRAASRRIERSATLVESPASPDFIALLAAAEAPAVASVEETATVASPEALALEEVDRFLVSEGVTFAVGDVLWGPEDGFVDLLCDVNEALEGLDPNGYGGRYRAVDARVALDAVLIVDFEDDCSLWSAPITIDASGEPVLADRDAWSPVEDGLIEVARDADDSVVAAGGSRAAGPAAPRIRAELRDFVLTAAATEVELPDEHQPGERLPARRPGVPAPEPTTTTAASGEITWEAVFVPEATLTDDGRVFAPESLSWRELPLSLMAMTATSAQGGHDGAVLAGRIDRIWREGSVVKASGVFDGGEFGQEIARMVGDGTLRGLSVDTAIHTYEVGPRSDYFDADGNWRSEAPTRSEEDDPSLADLLFGSDADAENIFVVTDAVIGMATVCPFPAFAQASISLVASGGGAIWRYSHQGGFTVVRRPLVAAAAIEETPATATVTLVPREVVVEVAETGERMTLSLEDPTALDEAGRQLAFEALLAQGLSEAEARGTIWPEPVDEALTASAAGHAPVRPPAEWFENPHLEELTPLTVTDDGRIFGHAWAWESCHIAFPDSCVPPPQTATENAYFHLGEIECEGGERLAVGKVTLDAPHAGPRLGRADATAHYDHTGTVAAHVCSGEDEFGGWVAGAISPDLSEAKLRLLRGSALSGDWRNVNGNLELVALLAVNVPGFPVPRPRALVASGDGGDEVLALTAAGIVLERTPCDVVAEIEGLALSLDPAPDVAGEIAALAAQV